MACEKHDWIFDHCPQCEAERPDPPAIPTFLQRKGAQGNDIDTQTSADQRKMEYALDETQPGRDK